MSTIWRETRLSNDSIRQQYGVQEMANCSRLQYSQFVKWGWHFRPPQVSCKHVKRKQSSSLDHFEFPSKKPNNSDLQCTKFPLCICFHDWSISIPAKWLCLTMPGLDGNSAEPKALPLPPLAFHLMFLLSSINGSLCLLGYFVLRFVFNFWWGIHANS